MTGAVERSHTGRVTVPAETDRAFQRLMNRARIIANMPGLKRELAGNPDAVAGMMLSLEGYGLPVTLPGINNTFDWIEGQATLNAQAYQALARRSGYRILPIHRSATKATARIEKPGEPPVDVEYTLDEARAAHRLDEWVEKWEQANGKWKLAGRLVVKVDGVPVNEPWPDWANAQIAAGRVKRFDAWWNYRTDMLWKAAAKRAVKIACPHVLLGVTEDYEHDTVWEPPVPEPGDDEIADAELVADEDLEDFDARLDDSEPVSVVTEPTDRRPASPTDSGGEAEPAKTGTAPQEGAAPAGNNQPPLYAPDEEPF